MSESDAHSPITRTLFVVVVVVVVVVVEFKAVLQLPTPWGRGSGISNQTSRERSSLPQTIQSTF